MVNDAEITGSPPSGTVVGRRPVHAMGILRAQAFDPKDGQTLEALAAVREA